MRLTYYLICIDVKATNSTIGVVCEPECPILVDNEIVWYCSMEAIGDRVFCPGIGFWIEFSDCATCGISEPDIPFLIKCQKGRIIEHRRVRYEISNCIQISRYRIIF